MNFNSISDTSFFVFLLCLCVLECRAIRQCGFNKTAMIVQWIMLLYEDAVLAILVWRTRRRLRALGRNDWADAIRVGVDKDDWGKND